MKNLTIIQFTPEELRDLIAQVIDEKIDGFNKDGNGADRLLTKKEICEQMRIKPSTFELHREGLIKYGLFQPAGKGSSYRMRIKDLEKYINSLIQKIQ